MFELHSSSAFFNELPKTVYTVYIVYIQYKPINSICQAVFYSFPDLGKLKTNAPLLFGGNNILL